MQIIAEAFDAREQKAAMMLGPNAPYVPLGCDGEFYYVIDSSRRVRSARPRDLSRNLLVSICGEKWLEERFPRTRKGKRGEARPVSGIAAEKAAAEMMETCDILGFWSPADHVRGLGAWAGADGDLILHRGSHLIVNGQVRALGRLPGSEHVYVPRTALPDLPRRERNKRAIDSAAEELRQRLDTFRWRRNTYDADLCLGWICAAHYSGALPWRTHLWVTGDFESGKTTLQNTIAAVFAGGMVSVTDTTSAGLWQAIQNDSCPVQVDELEPGSDPRGDRQMRVVQLMRQASSGALVLRGGAAGLAQKFTVRSPFFCASIIVPPMPSQDSSRIVVLHLEKDGAGAARVPLVAIGADLGARLARRMVDEYKRFRDDVMPVVRLGMMEHGFTARLADGYAPIWAAADVAQYDAYDPARLAAWLRTGPSQAMLKDALTEQTPEHDRCLAYLLSSRLDARRAEGETFGDLIERAAGGLARCPAFPSQGNLLADELNEFEALRPREQMALSRLRQFGVKIGRAVRQEGGEPVIDISVTIAAAHRNLAEIFQASIWRTIPEAANGGGWHQVLRRAPGAVVTANSVYFKGGVRSRAVVLPIELVLKMHGKEIQTLGAREARDDDERPANAPVH
jgi:hypothetical protein